MSRSSWACARILSITTRPSWTHFLGVSHHSVTIPNHESERSGSGLSRPEPDVTFFLIEVAHALRLERPTPDSRLGRHRPGPGRHSERVSQCPFRPCLSPPSSSRVHLRESRTSLLVMLRQWSTVDCKYVWVRLSKSARSTVSQEAASATGRVCVSFPIIFVSLFPLVASPSSFLRTFLMCRSLTLCLVRC